MLFRQYCSDSAYFINRPNFKLVPVCFRYARVCSSGEFFSRVSAYLAECAVGLVEGNFPFFVANAFTTGKAEISIIAASKIASVLLSFFFIFISPFCKKISYNQNITK